MEKARAIAFVMGALTTLGLGVALGIKGVLIVLLTCLAMLAMLVAFRNSINDDAANTVISFMLGSFATILIALIIALLAV